MKRQLARGVQDISPQDKALKNKITDVFREVFELYGFQPLETPIIERFETLTAKGGAGSDSDAFKEIFRLTDQGKRKLGLRFDLTVPLARYIAMNPTLKMPFKRYEMGRVYRDGPIKLGRTREFWQCDADIVGTNSMLADAECLAVVEAVFKKLDMNVVIKVNNRKILNGILNQVGIKQKEQAIIAIDKLDKIGKDGVERELKERGYTKKQIQQLFYLLKDNTTLKDIEKDLVDEEGMQGVREMKEVFQYLKQMGTKNVKYDLSLARGLAYYTGMVFEVFLKKGKITSSLAGGGRYDDLVKQLGGRDVPALGLSFGLVPILETLKDDKVRSTTSVLVIPIGTVKESLSIAENLRENGITTDFAMGKKGASKNLQYANALGIPYVAIIGENELKKNKILLRNMDTGSEQLLTLNQVVKKLG